MAESINIFDRVLKVLARHFPESLLKVALPGVEFELIGTPENIEIAIPEERVDFVHQVRFGDEERLVHIEFQTRHEAAMPERLFIYSALLTRQFKLPVLTFVFYLSRRQSLLPVAYEVKLGDAVVNRFAYPVIKLWEYEDEIRDGKWPHLAPLLVMFAAGEPDVKMLATERDLILQEQDDRKRSDLLACAITIGSRFFDRDFLWRFFREEVEMIREGSIIEEWLDEKLKEGLQQGIQQGIQQGQKSANFSVLIHLLTRRFSPLSQTLVQQLQSLSSASLMRLVDVALDAENVETFTQAVQKAMDAERHLPVQNNHTMKE
ncbi:MAG: DUF4351 domain-containing protein [Caldilineaceae bacterium]